MYFLFHFKQDKTISGILLIQVVKIREYWSLNSEKSQADYDGFFFFFFFFACYSCLLGYPFQQIKKMSPELLEICVKLMYPVCVFL